MSSDPCTIQSPLSPAGLWSVPMHLAFSCLGTIVSVGWQSSAPSLALSCPWQLLSSGSTLLSDLFTCYLHPHLILPCPAPPQCHHGLGGQRTEGERRQERLRQQEDAWLPRERPSPQATPLSRAGGVASPVLPGPCLRPPSTPFSCKRRCPKAPLNLHPSLALLSRPPAGGSPQLPEAPRLVPGSPRH